MLKLHQFIGICKQTSKNSKQQSIQNCRGAQKIGGRNREEKYTKEIEMWQPHQNKHTDPAPPIDMKRNIL